MDRETKPWDGQLYISHEKEPASKLLYKKFFRKTDCTILHGPWKHILLDQKHAFNGSTSSLQSSASADDIGLGGSPVVGSLNNNSPTTFTSNSLSTPISRPASGAYAPPATPPTPTLLSPISAASSSRAASIDLKRSKTVSSSRHGIIAPRDLDPIQCFVLFYPSCWTIPKSKKTRLIRIFGIDLVHRIEAYIRDEFNGEQCPGSSFILETYSTPCKYIVCTSIARNLKCLGEDFAYNAFRSALLTIHKHNREHHDDQINTILCPAMESIATSLPSMTYKLVNQMATCYEYHCIIITLYFVFDSRIYWDWHLYARGEVLPFSHEDDEQITKLIKTEKPSLVKIANDLNQYMTAGLLGQRGLVYDSELTIMLNWLQESAQPTTPSKKGKEHKRNRSKTHEKPDESTEPTVKTHHHTHVIAQCLVNLLKRPDIPPFTLTPAEICRGISGAALASIIKLAKERKIKIYDEILPTDIQVGNLVGEGASGKVYTAIYKSKQVALKKFIEINPEDFMNELTMMTLVRHPNLIECIGGYIDKEQAYIVTEFMDFNLSQLLAQKGSSLDISSKTRFAVDIAEAMAFLHSRGIIHRDLKSLNVVLNRNSMVAKVCDFGSSRVIDYHASMTRGVGSLGWIAPEIFRDKPCCYTEKCDVYSFGIIMGELLTNTLPFKSVLAFKIADKVKDGERPAISQEVLSATPKEYAELMKLCWHKDHEKRPSFTTVITKLRPLVPLAPRIPDSARNSAEFNDEDMYASDSDEEEDEDEEENTPAVVHEHEEQAIKELKPFLQRIKHQTTLATEELLIKCIRARHGKVVAAKHLLLRYIEWYNIINEGKLIKINTIRKTLESKVLFYVDGAKDKLGRNIIFWDLSHYDVDVTPETVLMRTFVYCLERATESYEAQNKGIILIANLSHWNMAHFSMRVINSFFGTVRQYFPVIVAKIFFLDPPGSVFKILTMYQSFIANSMALIEMVSQEELLNYVALDNLVPGANGTHHFDMSTWIKTRHDKEGLEYQ